MQTAAKLKPLWNKSPLFNRQDFAVKAFRNFSQQQNLHFKIGTKSLFKNQKVNSIFLSPISIFTPRFASTNVTATTAQKATEAVSQQASPVTQTVTNTIQTIDIPIPPPTPSPPGFFDAIWSSINPSLWAEKYVHFLHELTGLPWWATIVLTVVTIRAVVIPITLKQLRMSLMMKQVGPEMSQILGQMNEARREKDIVAQRQLLAEYQDIQKKHGVSPFSTLKYVIVQAPIFMSFFFGMQELSKHPELKTGGLSFFTDLSAVDPYMRLPILSGILFVLSAEFGTESIRNTPNPTMIRIFMYAMTIVMVFFSRMFPMAMHVYWCVTSLISLLQMRVLKNTSWYKKLASTVSTNPTVSTPVFAQKPSLRQTGPVNPSKIEKSIFDDAKANELFRNKPPKKKKE